MNSPPYTLDRLTRIVLALGMTAALVWLARYLSDALVPFCIALLAAYLMNPLAERLERLVKNRAVAVLGTLLLVAAALAAALALTAPLISGEVAHMGRLLSEVLQNSELAERAAKHLPPDIWQALRDVASRPEIQDMFKGGDALAMAKAMAAKVLPGVWGVMRGAAGLLAGLTGLVVIMLYTVFLMLDYRRVRDNWTQIIPPAQRALVVDFAEDFQTAMGRYFRAQAVVAACVGLLFSLGFGLIGLPLGILLGLFIGLLNMVPYLQLAGFVPAFFLGAIHALETGTDLWTTLALILTVFAVVQLIQDAVLTPRIMGQATGLSPAVILLSLSVWGKLLGMLGLLIAIPLTCLLWAWYQRYLTQGDENAA
ncbi:MAG: AI-2E family transporter [Proteobacteria bacterium]|nr:AI-2E family transporter [Pseudomonadota bacterium]